MRFCSLALLPLFICGCTVTNAMDFRLLQSRTGILNENPIVVTYDIVTASKNLPLHINLPTELFDYKYISLIAAQTQRTGGWSVEAKRINDAVEYCLKGPDPLSAVTMALSTPYILIGHNQKFEFINKGKCH